MSEVVTEVERGKTGPAWGVLIAVCLLMAWALQGSKDTPPPPFQELTGIVVEAGPDPAYGSNPDYIRVELPRGTVGSVHEDPHPRLEVGNWKDYHLGDKVTVYRILTGDHPVVFDEPQPTNPARDIRWMFLAILAVAGFTWFSTKIDATGLEERWERRRKRKEP